MKRAIISLALLLLVSAGPATADYLFITIDLNKVNFGSSGSGQAPDGGAGMGGGFPGGAGMGGGFPGGAGMGGGGFPGGGMAGFAGRGGGGMPGGFGMGGGAGRGGMPGGFGMGGGFPGGGNLGRGGGMPMPPGGAGNLGRGGGMPMPPGGGAGMAGGIPGMGGGPPGMGGDEFVDPDAPKHEITISLELRSRPNFIVQDPPVIEVNHKLGNRGRFPLVTGVPGLIKYDYVQKESPARQYDKKFSKDVQDGKDAARIIEAARWALGHGLKTKFHEAMAVLNKLDPKHAVAVAYTRVQADLKKPLGEDDPLVQGLISDLKAEGYRMSISEGGHYGMLVSNTRLPASAQMERQLDRRLKRFEEAYENFFYWFALQEGVAQPAMPKKRLLVVLAHDATDFYNKHAWWGNESHVADGFTPRRDNLIVLSARRLDDDYTILEKNTQQLYVLSRQHRDDFVSGTVWDTKEGKQNIPNWAGIQTLAIVQKAMEEEAERAAISHEGTKQLVFATGVLPRFVNVPEWVQFGLASYFDTPEGALYGGVGLPSWSQLIAFKHYRKYNRLGGSAQAALLGTISDGFFRAARQAEDPSKEKKDNEVNEEREIAQATAWAFVYYLAQNKRMGNLIRFGQELNQLPRDLDLDDRTLQACFARAFDMADAKDPRKLDQNRFKSLAEAWFAEMQTVSLEIGEVEGKYLGRRAALASPRTTPRPTQKGLPAGIAPPGMMPPGGAVPMPPGGFPRNLVPPGANPMAPPGRN